MRVARAAQLLALINAQLAAKMQELVEDVVNPKVGQTTGNMHVAAG
jgi:hypothetical protein